MERIDKKVADRTQKLQQRITTKKAALNTGKSKQIIRHQIAVKPLEASFEAYEEIFFGGTIAGGDFSNN